MNRFSQLTLPTLILACSLAGAPVTRGNTNIALAPSNSWSLQPIKKPAMPAVTNTTWPRNSIDYFILAKLEPAGLKPSAEADRATLIRRLSFDLIGLPPTPREVASFLADESPDAYERLVERLLAS